MDFTYTPSRDFLLDEKNLSLYNCLLVVQNDGDALELVPPRYQSLEVCMAAVLNKGTALRFVKRKRLLVCKTAVWKDGMALQYAKRQDPEMCRIAIKNNPDAAQFVKKTLLKWVSLEEIMNENIDELSLVV